MYEKKVSRNYTYQIDTGWSICVSLFLHHICCREMKNFCPNRSTELSICSVLLNSISDTLNEPVFSFIDVVNYNSLMLIEWFSKNKQRPGPIISTPTSMVRLETSRSWMQLRFFIFYTLWILCIYVKEIFHDIPEE